MPIKILMPALSPTMTEGNIIKWHKKEGDKVEPGQVIAEIETDKATMEVETVDEGILARIVVAAGTENVKVNSLIAVLLEEGEDKSALDSFKIDNQPKLLAEEKTTESQGQIPINEIPVQRNDEINKKNRIFASPLARKIAELENINLAGLHGSGPHGRIVKSDVLNSEKATSSSGRIVRNSDEYRVVPNNNVRKIIAKRLLESKQTIPHFYLSIECNIDRLLDARQGLNSSFGDDKNKKLSVNDFVIMAVAKALKTVPEANASWDEIATRFYNNVDISVAVAVDSGLITPVLRNADQKDILKLSAEMKELAKRARENKLTPEEFQGGGFTISNLGMYGIKNFSAIINPPQSCIMAVGASSKRPVVNGDQLTIATIMDITLSCDHRVVDGAVGARFLAAFKQYIEQPVLMFI